jgi:hypothetical protein
MGFVSALLYALLMNVVPLVEVIATGRSPGVLLLLYWFETVLMLVTGAVRIILHRRATDRAGHYAPIATTSDHGAGAAETRRAFEGGNTYLKSFLGITVIFTVVHGLFVAALVFLFSIGGQVSWADARAALQYAIVVQGLFLLWDLRSLSHWSFAELARNTGQVSLRVLVTQLGLIFGVPVAGITGSPWGFVGTLVALRALSDASIVWLERLVKQRDLPPGLARFLARRSKQSPESLEAEFDALKTRGAEVEALLELPIGEARAGAARRARAVR